MTFRGWDYDDNIARLTKMVADGFSAAEAGKALGVSRNAAMGKAVRLGMKFGGSNASTPEAVAARVAAQARKTRWGPKPETLTKLRAPQVRRVVPSSFGPRTMDEVKAQVERDVRDRAPPMLVAVRAHNRPFKALGAQMCRWPVSLDIREPSTADTLFCAAPTPEGQVYCDACRPRQWAPPTQAKYGSAYERSLRWYTA